jgi:hypothetical protein
VTEPSARPYIIFVQIELVQTVLSGSRVRALPGRVFDQFDWEATMTVGRAQPAYDPSTLSILQQAYDAACRERGMDPRSGDQDGHEARETLAKAVMHVAGTGVRDPRLLRERAIQAVMQRG